MNDKKPYVPPQITTATFKVEIGFTASGSSSSPLNLQYDKSFMEDFDFRDGWSDGSDRNSNTFWD